MYLFFSRPKKKPKSLQIDEEFYCTQPKCKKNSVTMKNEKLGFDYGTSSLHTVGSVSFGLLCFQQVQDDDLLISGFICLSSSSEIIPKCDGSSNIIFATKYPAIDHVWYFLACFPIYLPNFPS